MKQDWKKYLIAFLITALIFVTAISISSWFNGRRINELRDMQDSISLNILSSETQFNLLKDSSCEDLFSSSIAEEMGKLSDRLSYMESIGKGSDPDVITLKRYYSLLEIKDYLLANSAAAKCPKHPVAVLYFYQAKCPDCNKQAQVLTYLRQHYPEVLRVYSFDYELDVSAIKTLANIGKVVPPMPALIIKGKTYNGFSTVDDLLKYIPELTATSTATTTATSTKKK